MSEVAPVHSDVATARARIDRIAAHVAASRQDIIDAHRERDWLALGYQSWDDLCDAEFRGAMIGLPRGERREAVAEMSDAGMSTRAIGAALGVSDVTVRRDVGATNVAPGPVTGLDGKTYQPRTTVEVDTETGEVLTEDEWRGEHPEVATREQIVAAFPTLDVPEASDDDIRRVAEGLAKIPAIERDERAEYGRRWLEAKASGALDGIHQPDPCAPADLIVRAAIAVCSVARRNGGAEGFAAAWDQADAFTRENWVSGLRESASTIEQLIMSIGEGTDKKYRQLELFSVEDYIWVITEHMGKSRQYRSRAKALAAQCALVHGVELDVDALIA